MVKVDLQQMGQCRTKLSDVPSAGLRQVVADMRWALRQPGVNIYMSSWIAFRRDNGGTQCDVCAAGTVMLRRLWHPDKVRPGNKIAAKLFEAAPEALQEKLYAINNLRAGGVQHFVLRWLGRDPVDDAHTLTKSQQKCLRRFEDRWSYTGVVGKDAMRQFCQQCLKLAGALKKVGL